MPYRICKIIELESGHMLSKSRDNCRFPHGHSRQVELILEADELDCNDMVCDFSLLKAVLQGLLESFDHAMYVNTSDPSYEMLLKTCGERLIGFANTDPTTEVIARTIFEKIDESLRTHGRRDDQLYPVAKNVRLVRVRVWETSSCWAEYERPGPAGSRAD